MTVDESTLWGLCADKEFRHKLASVYLAWSLSRQIRGLRRARKWTQRELARRSGLSFGQIVLFERWCGTATIRSLQKIAHAFDVGLIVRFVGWGEFFLLLGREVQIPRSYAQELSIERAPEEP